MNTRTLALAGLVMMGGALAPAAAALADPAPAPGCRIDAAQMAVNKKAVVEFFRPGVTTDERVALMDPGYIQHNPIYVKRGRDDQVGTIEAFRRIQADNRAAAAKAPAAAGPKPPPPENVVVMGECDFVTIIRKVYRQDPTAAPGVWQETFPYDTYRMKGGKLLEHWDAFTINPPPTAPAR